jgi:hypothetical protein
MWVGPLCLDTMYTVHPQSSETHRAHDYRENRSTGGLLAYLLVAPTLAVVLAAPAVVFGVVLGVLGLTLGRRVMRRLRRRGGDGLSPPERSSRPA